MVCGRDVSPGDLHLEDFLFFPQFPPIVQKGSFPLGEDLLMCQEIDVPRSSPKTSGSEGGFSAWRLGDAGCALCAHVCACMCACVSVCVCKHWG